MNNAAFARAGEQVRDNITEIAERARDITSLVREQWDDTYHQVKKGTRRARLAALESMESTRKQIKARPLRSAAVVAGGAFAIGLLTGIAICRRR